MIERVWMRFTPCCDKVCDARGSWREIALNNMVYKYKKYPLAEGVFKKDEGKRRVCWVMDTVNAFKF